MTNRVIVQPRALRDLDNAYERAAKNAPVTASRWLNRFHETLRTLASNPERCPKAPEDELVEPEIRQLLFGKGRGSRIWRALFTIRDDEVHVLHIRRAVMDIATERDLFG